MHSESKEDRIKRLGLDRSEESLLEDAYKVLQQNGMDPEQVMSNAAKSADTWEPTPSGDSEPTEPKASWEYREEFGISKQMREIVKVSKEVSEKELDALRRKLDKLTYGG